MTNARKPAKKPLTQRAAKAVAEDSFGASFVEPREIIEAPFAPGQSPSLSARRMLMLMVERAATDGFPKDKTYRLTKREIRQGHKGNERIGDVVDEVLGIRLQIPGITSRGRASIIKAHLFSEIEEETDDGDSSLIEFEFSRRACQIFSGSNAYAKLNKFAVLAFQGKYAITLYQLGCLYCGRKHPEITLDVQEFRRQLGVPDGKYDNWFDLRRKVLLPAMAEIEQLAHFSVAVTEKRQGRKITHVKLGFWVKSEDDINAAADELGKSRVGRKTRRKDQQIHLFKER